MYESRAIELSHMMNDIKQINKVLNEIKLDVDFNKKSSSVQLLNYIEEEVKKTSDSIRELTNPFLLFIIGSGNYGKSTLINALLNQSIIETNDIPNTWKLDEFSRSQEEKMEIYYNNNTKILKSMIDGKHILQMEEAKFKKSKKHISNILSEYKKNNKVSTKELKEFKTILENQYLYKSNIIKIKYYLKKGDILRDFVIVDTPGLNQTLLKDTSNRMERYYEEADGVIWLIDASNIVSNETNKLISEISYMDRLYKNKKKKIAVVNKIDIIEQENLANIAKVKRRSREIYKDYFEDIVYISAKEALEGTINNNPNLIKSSNINDLYKSIDKNFTKACEYQQINSKYRNMENMRNKIIGSLYDYKRQLYKDISLYNQIEFELNKKSNQIYSFTSNYVENIRKKNICINQVNSILKEDIENLQNQCNVELKKLYDDIHEKTTLSKIHTKNNIDTQIYFTKNKNLIIQYNIQDTLKYTKNCKSPTQNLLNKLTLKNYDNSYTNEIIVKEQIYKKINNLKDEISETLKEKIKIIKCDLNKIKEEEFESKYLPYSKIKKHIECINNIEKILKDMR